jgi:hypothetical protein
MHPHRDVLEVRRGDADLDTFTNRIAELLTTGPALIVDISRHEDHGNRITMHIEAQENPDEPT